MDDFLHNLRSGKLKQGDRGRRDYTDYKGPQRRVSNERRKTDYYAKVTNENFAMIKETLDALADGQKRIADSMATREQTQTRIADALETIANMMESRLVREEPMPQSDSDHEQRRQANVFSTGGLDDQPQPSGNRTGSQTDLFSIISTMREQGDSWEKIARYFDEQNIPTVSGKGKWRGPAIKKYWMANS